MRSRLAIGLVVAVTALAAAGCKRKGGGPGGAPEAPPARPDVAPLLGAVSFEDRTPPEALPAAARVDGAALTSQVWNALRGSGLLGELRDAGVAAARAGMDVDGAAVARVRIEVAFEEVTADDKGAVRAAVRFRVDPRPSEVAAPHWSEDVQAAAETTYPLKPAPDRKAIVAKLASRMVGDLTASYLARQRVWKANASEVRAALSVDAGELRMEAIRAIGERRLTSEVPALLKLLSSDEEAVRDAALGALVEMRERRAVGELAKQRSMRDRREMRKILDAIATLGGTEASEYLAFVADTHEDEEIKGMAKQALERLKRKPGGGEQGK